MGLLGQSALRLLDQVRLRTQPRVASASAGEQKSPQRGSGTEFAEQREYAPGDDARRIDWKGFARNGKLHVRTFDEERAVRVWVLVDVSRSMSRGEPPKLERARELAASFGYLGLKQQELVQVLPFADSVETATPTLRRRDEYPALARFLEGLEAHGVTTFARTARAFAQRAPERGFVVLLSDLMEAEDWAAPLRSLAQRGHQLCVLRVRCDEDENPALAGELELRDAETEEALRLTVDARLLEAYREELALHLERVRAACRSVGASFLEAPVEKPLDPLLREVLAPLLVQR